MQRQGHIEVKFTNLCIKQQQGPVPINVVSKYEVNPFTDKEVMANVLIFAEMMIDDWQTGSKTICFPSGHKNNKGG